MCDNSNSTLFDSGKQDTPQLNPLEIKYLWTSSALTVEKADNDMLLDVLEFVKEQCELLPDRVAPDQTRFWTETINFIYERVCVELALRHRIQIEEAAQRTDASADGKGGAE